MQENILDSPKQYIDIITIDMVNQLVSLQDPPASICNVLSAVLCLQSNEVKNYQWKDFMDKLENPKNFISVLAMIDATTVNPEVIDHIKHNYLDSPLWDISSIENISKCCSYFAKWAEATINLKNM